jgi:HEAT repeat protein
LIARFERDASVLIESLSVPDLRVSAAYFLGDINARHAIPHLIPLLGAARPQARTAAAESLGKLGAQEATEALFDLANRDESYVVRTRAMAALVSLKGREMVPYLIECLNDDDREIRHGAAALLGELRDPSALEPLRESARKESWMRRGYQRRAIRAINARQK